MRSSLDNQEKLQEADGIATPSSKTGRVWGVEGQALWTEEECEQKYGGERV